MAKVLIIVGSDSDLPIIKGAVDALEKLGIGYDLKISSAHRVPDKTANLAKTAKDKGFSVIIAGAGMAAHLPGVVAAYSTLPVIGVPIKSGALDGIDALYSIAQMPKGIPVATVAVNGAFNAGILAGQIIGLSDDKVLNALRDFKESMSNDINNKDEKLQKIGLNAYINSR